MKISELPCLSFKALPRETTPFSPRIIRLFPRKKPFFLLDCTATRDHSLYVLLFSRSEILKFIWYFARLFVPLQPEHKKTNFDE